MCHFKCQAYLHLATEILTYLEGFSILITATLILFNTTRPIIEESRFTPTAFDTGLNITFDDVSEARTRCVACRCTDFIGTVFRAFQSYSKQA